MLGRAWEFHANGYIPLGNKDWKIRGWADEFGNYDYVQFRGHNQYDAVFVYHVETGPGADAELGRTLFKIKNILVKGLINGYYFHMNKNTDLRGGGATIAVQPNTYLEITANGSYDNYLHTQATLGVQVSLFDLFSNDNKTINDQDLHRRLFEPVQRNFANVGSGGVTRTTGNPRDRLHANTNTSNAYNDNGQSYDILTWYQHHTPERSNIWFFNGAVNAGLTDGELGATEDGTYENPYTSFGQAELASASEYTKANGYAEAYLYFSQGIYNSMGGDGIGGSVEVYSNESLWGRIGADNGYAEPATGNDRPVFIGGMQLQSNVSVNNIRVQNDSAGSFATGIILDNAQNVSINDSQIGVNSVAGSYVTGATMKNNSSLTISGSEIYGYNNAANAVGLEVQNGGNVTAINHSLIQGHSVNSSGIGLYIAPTIDASGHATSTIGNIIGDKTADFKGIGDRGLGIGLYAKSSAALGATTSIGSITDSSFTGNGHTFGYGLYAASSSNSGSATTAIGSISGSSFIGTSDSNYNGVGLAALSTQQPSSGQVSGTSSPSATTTIGSISDSNFTGSSARNNGFGLDVESYAKSGPTKITIANITGSHFTGTGDFQGLGLYVKSTSDGGTSTVTLNNVSGSSFTGNATGSGEYSDAYGILVMSTADNNATASTTIGNISDSHFTGTSTNHEGYGLFVESFSAGDTGVSNTAIGVMTGNTFKATSVGICGEPMLM